MFSKNNWSEKQLLRCILQNSFYAPVVNFIVPMTEWLKAVNYLSKKVTSYMFHRVLNTSLTSFTKSCMV